MAEAGSRNCWCQFHVLANAEAAKTTRDSRPELLRAQVAALGPPRGLIALDGDRPVGWAGVAPRPRLWHVVASRLVAASSPYPAEDASVWAVYCLLVPPRERRQRIATVLLRAAVEHAVAHGASAIEGYPIDTGTRGGVLPPGFSTGSLSMFQAEGFTAIAALPSGRTLVHKAF